MGSSSRSQNDRYTKRHSEMSLGTAFPRPTLGWSGLSPIQLPCSPRRQDRVPDPILRKPNRTREYEIVKHTWRPATIVRASRTSDRPPGIRHPPALGGDGYLEHLGARASADRPILASGDAFSA